MKKSSLAITTALALAIAGATPVSAAFAADLSVTGTVTLDGAPVGGVEVGWYDPSTDASGETVADASGAYTLTVADGHPYVLYAGIDHDAASASKPWKSVGGSAYTGVFVGASGTDYLYQSLTVFTTALTAQNIDLDKPGTVSGTNAVLAGKKIALSRLDGARAKTVTADSTGTFAFTGLVPGRYQVTRSFTSHTYATYESGPIQVTAGATATVDPVLKATGSISGVITNKGKPVAGVFVQSLKDSIYGATDTTDAKGRYTLANEDPGKWDIYLAPGSDDGGIINRPIVEKHVTATVTSGTTTTRNIAVKKGGVVTGSVVAAKKNSFLQVIVLDRKGNLLGGTYVQATSASKPTTFRIKAVETGAATLYITDSETKRFGSAALTVKAGTTNAAGAVAMTKKLVSLSGKVYGAKTGTVGFSAKVYNVSTGSAKVKNGRYTITGLLPVPGTVALASTSTYSAKTFSATPGGDDQAVKRGAKRPTLTGTFTLGGYPLLSNQGSIWLPGEHLDLGSAVVRNGVVSGKRLEPGTGTLKLEKYRVNTQFIAGSPFYYTVPKATRKITLSAAKTTDLGTVAMTIHR
jgi:hypothetical protein